MAPKWLYVAGCLVGLLVARSYSQADYSAWDVVSGATNPAWSLDVNWDAGRPGTNATPTTDDDLSALFNDPDTAAPLYDQVQYVQEGINYRVPSMLVEAPNELRLGAYYTNEGVFTASPNVLQFDGDATKSSTQGALNSFKVFLGGVYDSSDGLYTGDVVAVGDMVGFLDEGASPPVASTSGLTWDIRNGAVVSVATEIGAGRWTVSHGAVGADQIIRTYLSGYLLEAATISGNQPGPIPKTCVEDPSIYTDGRIDSRVYGWDEMNGESAWVLDGARVWANSFSNLDEWTIQHTANLDDGTHIWARNYLEVRSLTVSGSRQTNYALDANDNKLNGNQAPLGENDYSLFLAGDDLVEVELYSHFLDETLRNDEVEPVFQPDAHNCQNDQLPISYPLREGLRVLGKLVLDGEQSKNGMGPWILLNYISNNSSALEKKRGLWVRRPLLQESGGGARPPAVLVLTYGSRLEMTVSNGNASKMYPTFQDHSGLLYGAYRNENDCGSGVRPIVRYGNSFLADNAYSNRNIIRLQNKVSANVLPAPGTPDGGIGDAEERAFYVPNILFDESSYLAPVQGACCREGACEVLSEKACVRLGGKFQGSLTECSEIAGCQGVVAVTGACCHSDHCSIETSYDCAMLEGCYLGGYSTCQPGVCDNPACKVACCAADQCSLTTVSQCEEALGYYERGVADCGSLSCGEADEMGACEVDNTSTGLDFCAVWPKALCESVRWNPPEQFLPSAVYYGGGTSCNSALSTTITAPCCRYDGTCELTTYTGCSARRDVWHPDAQSCADVPCAVGACCQSEEQWYQSTEEGCRYSSSGEETPFFFLGLGTQGASCAELWDHGPCWAGESCFLASASECAGNDSFFSGERELCDAGKCTGIEATQNYLLMLLRDASLIIKTEFSSSFGARWDSGNVDLIFQQHRASDPSGSSHFYKYSKVYLEAVATDVCDLLFVDAPASRAWRNLVLEDEDLRIVDDYVNQKFGDLNTGTEVVYVQGDVILEDVRLPGAPGTACPILDTETHATRIYYGGEFLADATSVTMGDFVQATVSRYGDFDADCDVDLHDFLMFQGLFLPDSTATTQELIADYEGDKDIDLDDYWPLSRALDLFAIGSGRKTVLTCQPRIGPPDCGYDYQQPQYNHTLNLALHRTDSNPIAGGGKIEFSVSGELSGAAHDGLAGFSFDIALYRLDAPDGSVIETVDLGEEGSDAVLVPSSATLAFDRGDGFANASGFGGTLVDRKLVQVGGAQNTIGNSSGDFLLGTSIQMDVADTAETLVEGVFSLPANENMAHYELRIENIKATVLSQSLGGGQYLTDPADGVGGSLTMTAGPGPYGACWILHEDHVGSHSCSDVTEGQCRYVCDVESVLGTSCFGDVDGSGVVNASDRGFISANIGTIVAQSLCIHDLAGDGVVNASDRGFVNANIGQCTALPDYQNGSGLMSSLNGDADDRFSVVWLGAETDCATSVCEDCNLDRKRDSDQILDCDAGIPACDHLTDSGVWAGCDCNCNGIIDACDILDAADPLAIDCDADGLLDPCELDSNGDGVPDDCDQPEGTRVVDASGRSDGDGLEWGTAMGSLQEALQEAASDPTITQIWLKQGGYFVGLTETDTVEVRSGLSIIGGFAGDEHSLAERHGGPSILEGDIGAYGDPTDNVRHVLTVANATNVVLDGLTIQHGYADGAAADRLGAGVFISDSELTIRNCVIQGNVAVAHDSLSEGVALGGGVYIGEPTLATSTIVIENTRFYENRTVNLGVQGTSHGSPAFFGGAVYVADDFGGRLEMHGCLFAGNSAKYGGAVYLDEADDTVITNATFFENFATDQADVLNHLFGANTGDGGAVFVETSDSVAIRDSIFWHNVATGSYLNQDTSTYVPTLGASLAYSGSGTEEPDVSYTLMPALGVFEGDYTNGTQYPEFAGAWLADPPSSSQYVDDGRNLRITYNSPGRDVGSTSLPAITVDLDGWPRVVGVETCEVVDLGAYEVSFNCIGDTDASGAPNGKRNLGDENRIRDVLPALCAGKVYTGASRECDASDLDYDLDVDDNDLSLFLATFPSYPDFCPGCAQQQQAMGGGQLMAMPLAVSASGPALASAMPAIPVVQISVRDALTSEAVEILQAGESYVVEYQSNMSGVTGYTLFTVSHQAGQGVEQAVPAGIWYGSTEFEFADLLADYSNLVYAVGYPLEFNRYQMVFDQLLTGEAGPSGDLCSVRPEDAGVLRLHLYVWWADTETGELVQAEAGVQFVVEGEQPED